MKQVLQSYRTGELWLAEVPSPACPRNGVRVQVHASLVSAGTEKRMMDLAKSNLLQKAMKRPDQVRRIIQKVKAEGIWATWEQVNAKLDAPVPLGYSASGVVLEAGTDAAEFRVGQRVACAGVGHASHAEVIAVPRTLTVPLPDSVSFEQGCFGTLGAIAIQAVRQAEVQLGECVGVVGLGLLGNLVTQLLVAAGARVVATDLDPSKRDLALRVGAEAVGTDIAELAAHVAEGRGLDRVIIAAGARDSGIIQACPKALRHRGRIVVLGFVGMDCPHQEFYNKELELRMSMSYGPGRYDPAYEEKGQDYPYPFVRWTEQRNISSFLELVGRKRIDLAPLITHRFPVDDALKAYQLLESRDPYLGIVLQYPARAEALGRVVRPPTAKERSGGGPVKLALVGAGGFASGTLAPILRDLKVPVFSVVTNRGASAANAARTLDAEVAATDLEAAIGEPSVTHVVIATRHAAHAALAEKALRAGKAVHVEKPLCTLPEQLKHLETVVAELGASDRVAVGFNRRFSPLSEQLFDEVRSSAGSPLTIVYRVNAGVLDDGHWFFDDPGGRLVAEGCHFTDYCEFLVGQPAARVVAVQQGGRGRPFDSFLVTLGFADGSQASVIYCGQGDRSLRKERIEVFQNKRAWVLDDWSSLIRNAGGKESVLYKGRQNKGWREEMEHFLGIKAHPKSAPSWEAIVGAHRTLFAAVGSALGSATPTEQEETPCVS